MDVPSASLKYILVGDSSVGKTCICKRFCLNTFDKKQDQTVGLEFGKRSIKIDGTKVKLQIWDTAGQDKYRSITKTYFRSASVAFIVFDVTNRKSFDSIGSWLEDLEKYLGENTKTIKIIIANKIDLLSQRQVASSEAEEIAAKYGLRLVEVSASTGQGIEDIFMETAIHAYKTSLDSKDSINYLEIKPCEVKRESCC